MRKKLFILFIIIIFLATGGFVIKKNFFKSPPPRAGRFPEVSLPTIINGELILPKVSTPSSLPALTTRLAVLSANLAAVTDKDGKTTGIRVVGEVGNIGDKFINGANAIVRFYATTSAQPVQKIARPSANWDFLTVYPQDKVLYDVTVEAPPSSERLEVVFDVTNASSSALFNQLKIASRSMEMKTASSSGQLIEYYLASGRVVNIFANPISDIVIYGWAKNLEGRVFALGRTDFKNDLLNPGDGIDFKVLMVPFQSGQKFLNSEISAYGKEYKLSF
ncbi:hypothetical protein HY085_01670 [Candidatus Gottesmanbacteria bacterium]|nr:hypothetical protein [Candidatus Gottesmanbacteria bacterium]